MTSSNFLLPQITFSNYPHPPDTVKRELLASYSDGSPVKSFELAFVIQMLQSQMKHCLSQKFLSSRSSTLWKLIAPLHICK
jgi:CHASE2 domain-containing sensor protein